MAMREVWKYRLELGINHLLMPRGALPLTAQIQHTSITLWAEVDPTVKREQVTVDVVGTGHPVPDGTQYLATVQQPPFVWHVYVTRSPR